LHTVHLYFAIVNPSKMLVRNLINFELISLLELSSTFE
jgi:hypothetical protein